MSYIVSKKIKGKDYLYSVKNVRIGSKWKKITKYLGSAEGWSQPKRQERVYYGSFTKLASENFKISGLKVNKRLIDSICLIKIAASKVNSGLGLLDEEIADAIKIAAREIIEGKFEDQFILDVFQAGAGTPINMNVNEVIANRAKEIAKKDVYPNDHVNMSQSSNDVIPTAIRIASLSMAKDLVRNLEDIQKSFHKKSIEFEKILKVGRTHMQDAVPITLGKEFGAYKTTIKRAINRLEDVSERLRELGIGGTATGTAINTHPKYRELVVKNLRRLTKEKLYATESTIHLSQSLDTFVELSGVLRLLSIEMIKICNDLILLSSGPKAGIGEIKLPEVEPGSSIIPGKVNPSVVEAMKMTCLQVLGNYETVSIAAKEGQLELNIYTPVVAHNLFFALEILTNSTKMFKEKCIDGIEADKKKIKELFENSLVTSTAISRYLGYDLTAKLVKEAITKNKKVTQLILEKKILSKKDLDLILSIENLTGPSVKKNYSKK